MVTIEQRRQPRPVLYLRVRQRGSRRDQCTIMLGPPDDPRIQALAQQFASMTDEEVLTRRSEIRATLAVIPGSRRRVRRPLRSLTLEQIERAKVLIQKHRVKELTYLVLVVRSMGSVRIRIHLGPAANHDVQMLAKELRDLSARHIIANEADIRERLRLLHDQHRKAAGMRLSMARGRAEWQRDPTHSAGPPIRLSFVPSEMHAGSRVWQILHADEVRDYERQERTHVQRLLARDLLSRLHSERPAQASAVWWEIVVDGKPTATWSPDAQAGLERLRRMAGPRPQQDPAAPLMDLPFDLSTAPAARAA